MDGAVFLNKQVSPPCLLEAALSEHHHCPLFSFPPDEQELKIQLIKPFYFLQQEEKKKKKSKAALKMLKDIKGIHERVGWWLLQQGEKHYFTVQIKGSGKAAYL